MPSVLILSVAFVVLLLPHLHICDLIWVKCPSYFCKYVVLMSDDMEFVFLVVVKKDEISKVAIAWMARLEQLNSCRSKTENWV
jgi:hypothetical protein